MTETAITQMFGVRFPVIAAPMFLVSNVEMIVAVGEAGGIGTAPALNFRTTEAFREAVREIKQRTNAPFGINLILLNNPRLKEDLTVCLEERVPLIITSLGDPTSVIAAAHAHGSRVFCDVVNVRHAAKAKAAGADALVAVAAGAGGHAGTTTPFVLIPWLRREVGLPVVAAGGLADGGTLAAAMALGADAGYFGTRFIASTEAPVPPEFKDAICSASPEDIVYTPEVTGHPANFLKDSLEKWRTADQAGQSEMKRWRDVWSAGHTVGLIQRVRPCAEIVQDIMSEYDAARHGMPVFR
ncbi:MAG: nitronate monooxygenase [Candidatus Sericytochromatia bacterium]|nr:nitronate monooxygenase [Candidatus Sericytochromatia bacterium]